MRPIISVPDLRRLMDDAADLCVLDCRFDLAAPDAGDRAFRESHLPGAVRADLDRHLSGPAGPFGAGRHPLPAPRCWEASLRAWGIAPSTVVVAYDDAGGCFAARAWWLLRFFGHRSAAVLDGGWGAWLALAGHLQSDDARPQQPSGRGEAPAGSSRPAPEPDRGQVVLLEELATVTLVDARDPQRYAGLVEPIDPRAGHVPGARHRFWKSNLDEDGFFRSPERLRAEWLELLDGVPASSVASYCGSGVTACHNLLALSYAGLEGARLYPGSWSEYCSDPLRPAATGP